MTRIAIIGAHGREVSARVFHDETSVDFYVAGFAIGREGRAATFQRGDGPYRDGYAAGIASRATGARLRVDYPDGSVLDYADRATP